MPDATNNQATRQVVIAGMGLMTPMGHGCWATFRALQQGRRITDRLGQFLPDTAALDLVRGVGHVSTARHSELDPALLLAEQAAREAITEAGVEAHGLPTFLGCSKGAVHAWIKHDPLALQLGPHGYLAHHLQRRLGIEAWSHHVAACASGLIALDTARQAIAHDRCNEALVVSSESALHPLFVHSYDRLGVLAPLSLDHYMQRPLHQDRQGFVLAETGVAIVLRSAAFRREDQPWLELTDTATACEAHDLIRPSPTMSALHHVADHLCKGRTVACLHPHAPGTVEHDPRELQVLHEVTSRHAPAVYAVKGALGHTLGSAGLVSLVVAGLTARTGRTPPMPWLDQPMRCDGVELQREPQPVHPDGYHAVFAAGFGGHTAGALLRYHR
jgi:3-oxoacyl-[acyl-carrier-protein] synthase II